MKSNSSATVGQLVGERDDLGQAASVHGGRARRRRDPRVGVSVIGADCSGRSGPSSTGADGVPSLACSLERWNLSSCLLALAVAACGPAATAPDPPSPSASGGRPAVDLALTAKDLELQPAKLTAPSGSDIVLAFDNTDQGVPHGLALYGDAAHTVTLGTAEVIVGPGASGLPDRGAGPGSVPVLLRRPPDDDGRPTSSSSPDAARQPPAGPPPRPGSVIAAGSRSRSTSAGSMPRSIASSRIVRPDLKAYLASAAASS